MDANRPDYARAGADKETSHAPAGSCVAMVPVQVPQCCRSVSPNTILVIPSEVEESLKEMPKRPPSPRLRRGRRMPNAELMTNDEPEVEVSYLSVRA